MISGSPLEQAEEGFSTQFLPVRVDEFTQMG
jgi:hypothetical protein